MFEQKRLGDNGTRAARSEEFDDRGDEMNKQHDQVAHRAIVAISTSVTRLGYPQDLCDKSEIRHTQAVDFFSKPLVADVFLGAIRNAINRSFAALWNAGSLRALQDSYASLSRREREVMALIAAGRLNKQVGGELGITEVTVKAHRGKMMRKMHAGSLPELVRMADRLRLPTAAK